MKRQQYYYSRIISPYAKNNHRKTTIKHDNQEYGHSVIATIRYNLSKRIIPHLQTRKISDKDATAPQTNEFITSIIKSRYI